jgi:class 3 adenylate cyclase
MPERSLGEMLRRLRRAAGLTQEELAQRARIGVRSLSDLERGVTRVVRRQNLLALAEALECFPEERDSLLAFAQSRPPAFPVVPVVSPGASSSPAPDTPPAAASIHTFLSADVRGYTSFTLAQGDLGAVRLTARFEGLARKVVETHGGRVFGTRGDAVVAVFGSARQALRAALALQGLCTRASQEDPRLPLLVGVGLDAGEALPVGNGDFRGAALNLAARLCALAAPGEVLASAGVVHLARKVDGVTYQTRGPAQLKGFTEPVQVVCVLPADEAATEEAAATALGTDPGCADALESEDAEKVAWVSEPAGDPSASVPAARSRTFRRLALAASAPVTVPAFPPLVGRGAELDGLDRHLAGEAPPVLMLAGEPGIGKTRLLQEGAARAARLGWTVLAGGCHRRSGQEPYAPWPDTLSRFLTGRAAIQQRMELQGCAWLVRLLPELADLAVVPLPNWAVGGEQERRLMFQAVGRYLANVAGPAGTLLVLDDVQWAGADALDLLAAVVRTTSGAPVVRLLGAYRSSEVARQDPLAILLADLGREGLAAELELGPLAPDAAEVLLTTLLEGPEPEDFPLREEALAQADGVPFFLVSYAQGERDRRLAGAPALAAAAGVPHTVAQIIRQRVGLLAEHAQRLLAVAAVVGRSAPGGLLLALADRPEADALEALAVLMHARLLVEEAGELCVFAHDLIREVVLADLGGTQRRLLHRRVAQTLERTGSSPPEVLAYHFGRSDMPERALPFLERAGDRAAAVCAHAEAAEDYRELVDGLEQLGRTVEAALAREKLAASLRVVVRYGEALSTLEGALATYRALGDLDGQARVIAQIGWLYAFMGSVDRGVAQVQAFLAAADQQTLASANRAKLYAALASLSDDAGRWEDAEVAAERAEQSAREAEDMALVGQALRVRAMLRIRAGHVSQGRDLLGQAILLLDQGGDMRGLALAHNTLAYTCELEGAFDAAASHYGAALEVSERMGDPSLIALMQANRGAMSFYAGRWREARADLEAALATSRGLRDSWTAAHPPALLARLAVAQAGETEVGDIGAHGAGGTGSGRTEVEALLAQANALAERYGSTEVKRYLAEALSECDVLAGRAERARERLLPLLDPPGQWELPVAPLLVLLAWADHVLGQRAEAQAELDDALERARAHDLRPSLARGLVVRAQLAQEQSRWGPAAEALEESLALCRAMPYPYAEAKARYVYGQLYAAKGEPAPAREQYQAALAILDQLGERLYAEHVERALAELDASSAP